MTHQNTDAGRARSAAQRSIRRRCICGRVIGGNLGWASHQRANSYTKRVIDPDGKVHMPGDWLDGHGFGGRA